MPTVFAKILRAEIPAYKICENQDFLAFLDAFPIARAHVLVIPKQATDNFWDINTQLLSKILPFAQPIAKAIQTYTGCTKCASAVVGLEIAHAHLHLVPINHIQDLDFTRPKLQLSATEMQEIQQQLQQLISSNPTLWD